MSSNDTYDYIIVGAGTAGCTLAGRLTEDASVTVLLLEAGGWDNDPWIKIPLGFGRMAQKKAHDWGYMTEPQANMGGRQIDCRRGKVIGGSSSINAMGFVRGHRIDFDRWASFGLKGWSYKEVLPYFKRMETWEGGESEYRGGSGPIKVRHSKYPDPLVQAVLDAGVQAGHPRVHDFNAADQHGMSVAQRNIYKGQRYSMADAYLRPALSRSNLKVETHAMASRIVIENGRAVGIEFTHGGVKKVVRAKREVLLSGGVINTTQLLMLSGIGHPDELAKFGIEVKSALPGVGKNLQDHVMTPLTFKRKNPGSLLRHMRLDRIVVDLARAYIFGTGFATELPAPISSYLKTSPELPAPDIQVLSYGGPPTAAPYFWPFSKPYQDGFSLLVVLLRPVSRGYLELVSTDPLQPMKIHQNFLTHDDDWRVLAKGIRLIRNISRQKALEPFVAEEIGPIAGKDSDEAISDHIHKTGATVYHPMGTCKMGAADDPMAVVDDELRVRGVAGLRVVDASVMPDLVGGNINSAIVMIAERASDLIKASR